MKTLLTWRKCAPMLLAAGLAGAACARPALDELEREAASLREQVQRQERLLQDLGGVQVRPVFPGSLPWAGAAALLVGGALWLLRRRSHAPGARAHEPDGPEPLPEAAEVPTQGSASLPHERGAGPDCVTPTVVPAVSTEALRELEQQAEFFTSLGRSHEAVRLYEKYLEHGACPAPLAWLELMELHRQGGDLGACSRLAHAFEERFGCPPPQDRDVGERAALEAGPALLADLQALWPQPGVLEGIEALLGAGGAVLPREAARELLWLHGFVQQLEQPSDAVAPPALWMDDPGVAGSAPRGLDIDLDALAHARAQTLAVRVIQMPTAGKAEDVHEWDPELFDAATGFERRFVGSPGLGARV